MMTIAQFCVDLLAERGPLSAEALGQACGDARVSGAQKPAHSVVSALAGERRVVRLADRRYVRTIDLLEGRWLTTHLLPFGEVAVSVNLAAIAGPLRHGLPLASGGRLYLHRYGGELVGPKGWLPPVEPDEVLGVHVTGGALELRALRLDHQADLAGVDLARRLLTVTEPMLPLASEHGFGCALLRLMHTDPGILREPVPPLCDLLPPLHERYWPCDAALFDRWDPDCLEPECWELDYGDPDSWDGTLLPVPRWG
jgi:hypothetical protein